MPTPIPVPKFRDIKSLHVRWNNWKHGLNTLVAPSKIRDTELSVARNIVLVDEGSPRPRPGVNYFGNASGADGTKQGTYAAYFSNGDSQLLTINEGLLKKFNSTTENWDLVLGGSFPSTERVNAVMAQDSIYFSDGINPLSKYDGSSISVFSELSAPSSNWASRGLSLPSGPFVYSYRVTAVNSVGETIGAAATTIAIGRERENWNPDPSSPSDSRAVTLGWATVVGATGYNIYGVNGGDERYLDHVDGQSANSWIDYGTKHPSAFFPIPVGNSTTGPRGKFVMEFKSALVIAGDPENPSRVYYSAGLDKVDSFLISEGGGYVDISKNSNDGEITGLTEYQDKAVILKQRSLWQMQFTEDAIPSIANVINGIGCVSHRTIKEVENDIYFMGRKIGGGMAIYVLGNEPNYLNVLRTNELSARVRPDLLAITPANADKMVAEYFDGKYMVFYPEGGAVNNNAAIVYDRERLGFTKWDGIYVDHIVVYYDNNNVEYLLSADGNDNRISEISTAYTTDKGTAIGWNIKTKETDSEEPFIYKKYKWVNLRMRNVGGTVRFRVWTDGNITAYQSSISVAQKHSAFGSWQFGTGGVFGKVVEDSDSSQQSTTIIRRIPISRQGIVSIAKSLALELYGDTTTSRATLLDVHIEAKPKSKNYYPRNEVISS